MTRIVEGTSKCFNGTIQRARLSPSIAKASAAIRAINTCIGRIIKVISRLLWTNFIRITNPIIIRIHKSTDTSTISIQNIIYSTRIIIITSIADIRTVCCRRQNIIERISNSNFIHHIAAFAMILYIER